MTQRPLREIACVSSSPEETRAIAAVLGPVLRPGDVVMLSGDLGAGKTCFVQGAAAAMGVTTRVTSPSFVLVREYRGRAHIVHVDVYRLETLQELIDLGYEEVFAPDAIVFVEWGDAVSGVLPEERLEVELHILDDDRRRIVLRPGGSAWESRLDDVQLERWEVPA